MDKFDFETKKELSKLIASIVKLQIPGINPLVEYLYEFHPQYIEYVIKKLIPFQLFL